ncbi:MAG: hypothetical protein Q9180_006792 [Flavoplaca navasiana]
MYEEMGYETYIPFFNPPLELETKDGAMTDKDPGAVFDESRWAMPEKPEPQEDDEVEIHFPNRFVRRGDGNSGISGSRNFTAVVISTSPRHSAKELCESPTSRGDDFVSSTENLFCDMELKKLWPQYHEAWQRAEGARLSFRHGSSGEVVYEDGALGVIWQ